MLRKSSDLFRREPGSADAQSSHSTTSSSTNFKMVPYYPKKKREEDVLFVMKHKMLKEKLNESCKHLCSFAGSKIPLQIKPVGRQVGKRLLFGVYFSRINCKSVPWV